MDTSIFLLTPIYLIMDTSPKNRLSLVIKESCKVALILLRSGLEKLNRLKIHTRKELHFIKLQPAIRHKFNMIYAQTGHKSLMTMLRIFTGHGRRSGQKPINFKLYHRVLLTALLVPNYYTNLQSIARYLNRRLALRK